MHCIQHLAYKPKLKIIVEMKKRPWRTISMTRMAITASPTLWDRVLGTFYDRPERPNKSPTVFNLGYTTDVAKRYPWVKELSGGIVATGHPRKRQHQG